MKTIKAHQCDGTCLELWVSQWYSTTVCRVAFQLKLFVNLNALKRIDTTVLYGRKRRKQSSICATRAESVPGVCVLLNNNNSKSNLYKVGERRVQRAHGMAYLERSCDGG